MTAVRGRAPGRVGTLAGLLLITGATLVGGLLNAALIALAARRGEVGEIAAYTVMTAVLTIVSVTLGGGSSTLYLSGTDLQRQGVRSQRVLLVVPSLFVAGVVVGSLYGARGYSLVALGATALTLVANNLSELPLAQMHRDMRFRRIAIPTLLGKLASLVAFLPGAPLTFALLTGAVVNLVVFEMLAGAGSPMRALWYDRPSPALARNSLRAGGGLYTFTLAELFAARVPSIGLSLVVAPVVMGSFGAVATALQAIMTVFQSGLNMVLSLRARAARTRRPETEVVILAAALLGAAVMIFGAPWLAVGLLGLPDPAAATWLRVLGAALPFILVNRLVAFRAIGDGNYDRAARLALALAVLTPAVLVPAIPLTGPVGATLATLVAESTVAIGMLALRFSGFGSFSGLSQRRAAGRRAPAAGTRQRRSGPRRKSK